MHCIIQSLNSLIRCYLKCLHQKIPYRQVAIQHPYHIPNRSLLSLACIQLPQYKLILQIHCFYFLDFLYWRQLHFTLMPINFRFQSVKCLQHLYFLNWIKFTHLINFIGFLIKVLPILVCLLFLFEYGMLWFVIELMWLYFHQLEVPSQYQYFFFLFFENLPLSHLLILLENYFLSIYNKMKSNDLHNQMEILISHTAQKCLSSFPFHISWFLIIIEAPLSQPNPFETKEISNYLSQHNFQLSLRPNQGLHSYANLNQ